MLSFHKETNKCPLCNKTMTSVQVNVCGTCISEHCSQPINMASHLYSTVQCACCCYTRAQFQVWLSVCVSCQLKDLKPRPSVDANRISFLQRLDGSPLSDDFIGDVSLTVQGSDKSIQAHRFILASKSPVFKKMMEIDMAEKLSGKVNIEDISFAVVRAAVNFMYTGEIVFSEEVSPSEVLRFSHLYEIQWLKELCEIELVREINSENILEMLSISYRFGAEMLKEKARNFFTRHPEVHNLILDEIFTNMRH